MKIVRVNKKFNYWVGILCIAIISIFAIGGTALLSANVSCVQNTKQEQVSTSTLTITDETLQDAYIVFGNSVYKYSQSQNSAASLVNTNLNTLTFNDQNTLKLIFLKDSVNTLSATIQKNVASVLTATKTQKQIEISIQDQTSTVYISTSLDATYSFGALALSSNSKLSYANGEFTVGEKRGATSYVGIHDDVTSNLDAQIFTLDNGVVTFKGEKVYSPEYKMDENYNTVVNGRAFLVRNKDTSQTTKLILQKGIVLQGFIADFGGAIYASSNTVITLAGADIVACSALGGNGGAIESYGDVELVNAITDDQGNTTNVETKIEQCTAYKSSSGYGGNGGAIYCAGKLTINGGKLIGNSAEFLGGAVCLEYVEASLDIQGATFVSNCAISGNGGAIYTNGGSASRIEGTTFESNCAYGNGVNQSAGNGGAIYYSNSSPAAGLTIATGTAFVKNSAVNGGAIYNQGRMTIGLTTFKLNMAQTTGSISGNGGAIYNQGKLTIQALVAENNEASNNGGVIYATGGQDSSLTINSVYTYTNRAEGNKANAGGVIYVKYNESTNKNFGSVEISNLKAQNNSAKFNGAVYQIDIFAGSSAEKLDLKINGGTYAQNKVTNGAIRSSIGSVLSVNRYGSTNLEGDFGDISIHGATIENNSYNAPGNEHAINGATICIGGGSSQVKTVITGCTFDNNQIPVINNNCVADIYSTANLTLADNEFSGSYNSVCNLGLLYIESGNSWFAGMSPYTEYAIIHRGEYMQYAGASIQRYSTAGIFLAKNSYITVPVSGILYSTRIYKEDVTAVEDVNGNSSYIACSDTTPLASALNYITVVNQYLWMKPEADLEVDNCIYMTKRDYAIRFFADWGEDYDAQYSVNWQSYTDQIGVENLLDSAYWNYAGSNGYTADTTTSSYTNATSGTSFGYYIRLDGIKEGAKIDTISAPIPIARGFTFTGWYTADGVQIADANGLFSQTNFDAVDIFNTGEVATTGVLNVFAKWELTSYNYTVDLKGGVGTNTSGTYNIIDGFEYDHIPMKSGYTFNGWKVSVTLNELTRASINSSGVLFYNSLYENSTIFDLFYLKSGVEYTASSTVSSYAVIPLIDTIQWLMYDPTELGQYKGSHRAIVHPPLSGGFDYDANTLLRYTVGATDGDDYITISFEVDNLEDLEALGFLSSDYGLTGDVTLTAQWKSEVVTVNVSDYKNETTTFYYYYGKPTYYSTKVDDETLSDVITNNQLSIDLDHTGWILDGYYAYDFYAYKDNGNIIQEITSLQVVDKNGVISGIYAYYPNNKVINASIVESPTRYSVSVEVPENLKEVGYLTVGGDNIQLIKTTIENIPYGTKARWGTDADGNNTLTFEISGVMSEEDDVVITAHVIEQEGCTRAFISWYCNDGFFYITTSGRDITEDLALTARIKNEAIEYSVYLYHCNDESVTLKPGVGDYVDVLYQTYATGIEIANPLYTEGNIDPDIPARIPIVNYKMYLPTREHYTFRGYYAFEDGVEFDWTNYDGNESKYLDENLYITERGLFNEKLFKNTTDKLELYARWEINLYNVAYSCRYNPAHCTTVYLTVTDPNGNTADYYGEGIISGYTIKHSIVAVAEDLHYSERTFGGGGIIDQMAISGDIDSLTFDEYFLYVKIGETTRNRQSGTTTQDVTMSISNSELLNSLTSQAKEISIYTYNVFKLPGKPSGNSTGNALSQSTDKNFTINIYGTSGYTPIATIYRKDPDTDGDGTVSETELQLATFHTNKECTSAPITSLSSNLINSLKQQGYTFHGFYESRSITAKQYVDAEGNILETLKNIKKGASIYAYWTANSYIIAFDANYPAHNGGTSAEGGTIMEDLTTDSDGEKIVYGTTVQLTANSYTLTGYTFNGWNTKADGTGRTYENQSYVNFATITDGETVTLYAQWTAKVYTLTLTYLSAFAKYLNARKTITLYYVLDQEGYYTTASAAREQNSDYKVEKIADEDIQTATGFILNGYYYGNTRYIDNKGNIVGEIYKLRTIYNADIYLHSEWTRDTYSLDVTVNDDALGEVEMEGFTVGDKIPYGTKIEKIFSENGDFTSLQLSFGCDYNENGEKYQWDAELSNLNITLLPSKKNVDGYTTKFIDYAITNDSNEQLTNDFIGENITITFNFTKDPMKYSVALDPSIGASHSLLAEYKQLVTKSNITVLYWYFEQQTIYMDSECKQEYSSADVIPSYVGHTFVGWFDISSSYDSSIEDQESYGTKYINADGTINTDIETPLYNERLIAWVALKAHWTINKYTITISNYFNDAHCTTLYTQVGDSGEKLYGQVTLENFTVHDALNLKFTAQNVTPVLTTALTNTFGFRVRINNVVKADISPQNTDYVHTELSSKLVDSSIISEYVKDLFACQDDGKLAITIESTVTSSNTTAGTILTSSTSENHVRIDMFNTSLNSNNITTYYLNISDHKLYTDRNNSSEVSSFDVLDHSSDPTKKFVGYNQGNTAGGEQFVSETGEIDQSKFGNIVGYTQLATAWETKTITVTLTYIDGTQEFIYFKAGVNKYYTNETCVDVYSIDNFVKSSYGRDYNGYFTQENGQGTQYIAGSNLKGAFINDLYTLTDNIILYVYMPLHIAHITLDAGDGKFASGKNIFDIYFKYNEPTLYVDAECNSELTYTLLADGETKQYYVAVPQLENYLFTKFEYNSGNLAIDQSGNVVQIKTNSTIDETITAKYSKIYGVVLNADKYSDDLETIHREATTSGTQNVYYAYGQAKFYDNYIFENGTSTFGTEVTSGIEIPTLTGYTFAGYWTNIGGTGIQYIDKDGKFSTQYHLHLLNDKTAILNLYAKWEANYYQLAINPNGGTVSFEYTENKTYSLESSLVINDSKIYALYDSNQIFHYKDSMYYKILKITGEKEGAYLFNIITTTNDNAYAIDNLAEPTLANNYQVNGRVELTAIWETEKYFINFDINPPYTAEYDIIQEHEKSIEIIYNNNQNLVEKTYLLTLEGHKFNGYYTQDKVQLINENGEFVVAENYIDADLNWIADLGDDQGKITLYAYWTPIIYYTVVNGTKIERVYGQEFEVKFVRPDNGYYTIGFNISGMNEGIKHYIASNKEDFSNVDILSDITTTATSVENCTTKWFKNLSSQQDAEVIIDQQNGLITYHLEYENLDRLTLDETIEYTTEYTIEDTITLPTVLAYYSDGYSFAHFDLKNSVAVGSWSIRSIFSSGQSLTGQYGYYLQDADGFITGKETQVVLGFRIRAKTYKLTFDANNGELNHASEIEVTYAYKFALPDLFDKSKDPAVRTGYTFTGYTTQDGKTIFDSNGAVTNCEGYVFDGKWMYVDNLTVYAQWGIVNEYTITYTYNMHSELEGKDGYFKPTEYNPTTYTIETESFRLTNPTQPGYTFAGWIGTDITNGPVEDVYINKGSFGDRAYEAVWNQSYYNITFTNPENYKDAEGNLIVLPSQYQISTTDSSLLDYTIKEPSQTGYNFMGYNITVGGKSSKNVSIDNEILKIKAFTYGNIKIEAGFAPKIYTLSFEETDLDSMKSKVEFKVSPSFDGNKNIMVSYDRSLSFTARAEAAGYQFNGFVVKGTTTLLFNADGSLNKQASDYVDANSNWCCDSSITVVGTWTPLNTASYNIVVQYQNLDGSYTRTYITVENVETDSFITYDKTVSIAENEFEEQTGDIFAGYKLVTTPDDFGNKNQATSDGLTVVTLIYNRKQFDLTITNFFEDEYGNTTGEISADENFAGFASQKVTYGERLDALKFSSGDSVVYERVVISDDYAASSKMPASNLALTVTFYRYILSVKFVQITQTYKDAIKTGTPVFEDSSSFAGIIPSAKKVRYGTNVYGLIEDKPAMANDGFTYYDISGVNETSVVTEDSTYTIRFTRNVAELTFSYSSDYIASANIEITDGVQKLSNTQYKVAYNAPMNIEVVTQQGYIITEYLIGDLNVLKYCTTELNNLQHTYTCTIDNQEIAESALITITTDPYDKVPYKVLVWTENLDGGYEPGYSSKYEYGTTGTAQISSLSESEAQTGFEFAGWNQAASVIFSPEEVSGKLTDSFTILGNGSSIVNLFFNRKTYSVEYNLTNAHSPELSGRGILGNGKIKFGAQLSLEAVADTGYHISSVKVNNAEPISYKNGVSFAANQDETDGKYTIIITAEANEYTVVYYTWEESFVAKSEPFTFNVPRALDTFASESSIDPLNEKGYNFIGWATTPQDKRLGTISKGAYNGLDSDDIALTNGQEVSTLAVSGEVKLYAVYEALPYTVYLNAGEGGTNTGVDSFKVYVAETQANISLKENGVKAPEKFGYYFVKWTETETFASISGDVLTVEANIYFEDGITLNANYNPNAQTITFASNLPTMKSNVSYTINGDVYTDETVKENVFYDVSIEHIVARAEAAGYQFNGFIPEGESDYLFDSLGALNKNLDGYTADGKWQKNEPITVYASWTAETSNYQINLILEKLDGSYENKLLTNVQPVTTDSLITFDTAKNQVTSQKFRSVTGYDLQGFNLQTTSDTFGEYYALASGQTVTLTYNRKVVNVVVVNSYQNVDGTTYSNTDSSANVTAAGEYTYKFGAPMKDLVKTGNAKYKDAKFVLTSDTSVAYTSSSVINVSVLDKTTTVGNKLQLNVTAVFDRQTYTINFTQKTQTLNEALNTANIQFSDVATTAGNIPTSISGVRYGEKIVDLIDNKQGMANAGFAYYDIEGVDSNTQVTGQNTYTIRFTRDTFTVTITKDSNVNTAELSGTGVSGTTVAFDANVVLTVETKAGYAVKPVAITNGFKIAQTDATISSYKQTSTHTYNHSVASNVNISIQSTGNEYTVEYYQYNGTEKITESKHFYGASSNLTTFNVTTGHELYQPGYTFAGWIEATSAQTTRLNVAQYSNGAAVTDLSYGAGTDIVAKLYACYTPLEFSVSLNADTGVLEGSSSFKVTVSESLQTVTIPAIATEYGYTFTGWTVPSGVTGITVTNKTTLTISANTYIDGGVTLTASFTANSVKVIYTNDSHGGFEPVEATYYYNRNSSYNSNYTFPTVTPHDGYDFSGWTLELRQITKTYFVESEETLSQETANELYEYAVLSGTLNNGQATINLRADWPPQAGISYSIKVYTETTNSTSTEIDYELQRTATGSGVTSATINIANTGSGTSTIYGADYYARLNNNYLAHYTLVTTQDDLNNATIAGDGSTVISLYYNRIEYALTVKNYYQSVDGTSWTDDSSSETTTGGTVTSSSPYKHGYPLTGLSATAKTGFEWDGYFYQNSDGTGNQYTAESTMPTADLTVYARFARKQYSVTVVSVYQGISSTSWTVDTDNSVAGTITGSGNLGYYQGKVLDIVSATNNVGFTFDKFYKTYSNGSFSEEVIASTLIGAANLTVYAKFTRNNVTLTVNIGINITSFTVNSTPYTASATITSLKYQETFTLEVVTKNGYTATIRVENLTVGSESNSTDGVNVTTYTNSYTCVIGFQTHAISISSVAGPVGYNVYHVVQGLDGTYSAGDAIPDEAYADSPVQLSTLHMDSYSTNYVYKGYSASLSNSAAGANTSTTEVTINGNGQTKIYLYYQLKTYKLTVSTKDNTTTAAESSVKINNTTYSAAVTIPQTATVNVTVAIKYGFTLTNITVNSKTVEFTQGTANSTTTTYTASFTVSGDYVSGKDDGDTIDLVYTATRNNYTVTVQAAPTGYGTVTPTSITVTYQTTITTSDNLLKNGSKTICTATATVADAQYSYAFSNWSVDGSAVSAVTITGDTTITANFMRSIRTYTVSISIPSAQSGWGTVSQTSVTAVPYGTTITASSITLTIDSKATITATATTDTAQYDYGFSKWTHTSATGSTVSSSGIEVKGNTNIYAHFSRTVKQYTVTVVADPTGYGSVTPQSVTVNYGTTITASEMILNVGSTAITAKPATQTAKYTYSFKNWTLGSTTGTQIGSSGTTVQGAITIYANFTRTIRNYTVKFEVNNSNYGEISTASVSIAYDTNITVDGKQLVANGTTIVTATKKEIFGHYTGFSKWTFNDEQITSSVTVQGNMTIKAIFECYAEQFTLTLNANKPNGLIYNNESYTASASVYSGSIKIDSENQLTVTFTYNSSSGYLPTNQYTLDGWTLLGWELVPSNTTTAQRYSGSINTSVINSWYTEYKNGEMTELYAVWQPKTFTVNYYKYTGTEQVWCAKTTHIYDQDSRSLLIDVTTINQLCPLPDNGGYIFDGWGIDADIDYVLTRCDFQENDQAQTALLEVAGNKYAESIDLYARYYPKTVCFIADFNGGSLENLNGWYEIAGIMGDPGVVYTFINYMEKYPLLPTATKEDHIFDGWYTEPTGGTKIEDDSFMTFTTDVITIYAHYISLIYTINWNGNADAGDLLTANLWNYAGAAGYSSANTGSNGEYTTAGVVATSKVTVGQALGYYAPIPIRRGYTFNGWYTATSGGDEIADNTGAFVASVDGYTDANGNWKKYDDVTLYAQYTAKTYTITVNSNGGSTINNTSYTVESGQSISAPTRDGYTFAGWIVDVSLDKMYNATINLSNGVQEYDSRYPSAVYYEMFYMKDGITYKSVASGGQIRWRTYTANGGFGGNTSTDLYHTLENKNMMLWYHLGNGNASTTISFEVGTGEFNTSTYKLTGDVVLTPKWTPVNYSITYDLAGGTVASANPASYTITTNTFTLNNPTRSGYTFAGWTGTGLSSATTTVKVEKGSYGKREYTATWTPVEYTITYNLDGGTAENPTTYTVETESFTLNNPTKTGYTFTGWTGTGLSSATTTVTVGGGQTGNREYTANYKINNYLVKIDGVNEIEDDDYYAKYIVQQKAYDGINQYHVVDRKYMFTDSITVNVWAQMGNWLSFGNNENIKWPYYETKDMRIYSCTEGGGWNLETSSDGYIQFACYDDGLKAYNNITTSKKWSGWTTVDWHMFTMTFDGKTLTAYIDGEYAGSTTFTGKIGYNPTNSIFIGAEAGSSASTPVGGYFDGNIRSFSISNTSMTQEMIKTMYNAMHVENNSSIILGPMSPNRGIYLQQQYNKEFVLPTFPITTVTGGTDYTGWKIENMDSCEHTIGADITTELSISITKAQIFNNLHSENGGIVTLTVVDDIAGIYAIDGTRLYSWEEAKAEGYIESSSLSYISQYNYTGEAHLVLPGPVKEINSSAFEKKTGLKAISISPALNSMGSNAFDECTNLQSIYITDLAAWCKISFGSSGNSSDEAMTRPPQYYASKFYLNGQLVIDLVIPEGITSISAFAFEGLDCIRTITIPDSVTYIGQYAFARLPNLGQGVTVTIPASVTEINRGLFYASPANYVFNGQITQIGTYAFTDYGTSLAYGIFFLNCDYVPEILFRIQSYIVHDDYFSPFNNSHINIGVKRGLKGAWNSALSKRDDDDPLRIYDEDDLGLYLSVHQNCSTTGEQYAIVTTETPSTKKEDDYADDGVNVTTTA